MPGNDVWLLVLLIRSRMGQSSSIYKVVPVWTVISCKSDANRIPRGHAWNLGGGGYQPSGGWIDLCPLDLALLARSLPIIWRFGADWTEITETCPFLSFFFTKWMSGGSLKWGYPQSSSILDGDFPSWTMHFWGKPHILVVSRRLSIDQAPHFQPQVR